MSRWSAQNSWVNSDWLSGVSFDDHLNTLVDPRAGIIYNLLISILTIEYHDISISLIYMMTDLSWFSLELLKIGNLLKEFTWTFENKHKMNRIISHQMIRKVPITMITILKIGNLLKDFR